MRPRVLHLAWLIVLLSSVSAAKAGVCPGAAHLACTGHYARVLLGEQATDAFAAPMPPAVARAPRKPVPPATEAVLRTAWTMRPPAAQALALQAATARAA